jgi:hypothetical protein
MIRTIFAACHLPSRTHWLDGAIRLTGFVLRDVDAIRGWLRTATAPSLNTVACLHVAAGLAHSLQGNASG